MSNYATPSQVRQRFDEANAKATRELLAAIQVALRGNGTHFYENLQGSLYCVIQLRDYPGADTNQVRETLREFGWTVDVTTSSLTLTEIKQP